MKRLLIAATFAMVVVCGCGGVNPRVATRLNDAATLSGTLPGKPLAGRVITSWIDKSDAQHPTMSTLFGNDAAVGFARSNSGHEYPVGSVLSLVTWGQQEDERWFGGNIPAGVRSVEMVAVKSGPDGKAAYEYRRFEGSPLKDVGTQSAGDRVTFLLVQRAAVMP